LACIFKSLLCFEGYETAVETHCVCVCVPVLAGFQAFILKKNWWPLSVGMEDCSIDGTNLCMCWQIHICMLIFSYPVLYGSI